jgi:Rrf2 family protein
MAVNEREIYSVHSLHRQLDLPYKYLGKLMGHLAEARLVEPIQGKRGGYRLARPASRIYLYEIIGIIEGLNDYQRCILGLAECSGEHPCALHENWVKIRESMKEMIYNVSIDDLLKVKRQSPKARI